MIKYRARIFILQFFFKNHNKAEPFELALLTRFLKNYLFIATQWNNNNFVHVNMNIFFNVRGGVRLSEMDCKRVRKSKKVGNCWYRYDNLFFYKKIIQNYRQKRRNFSFAENLWKCTTNHQNYQYLYKWKFFIEIKLF